MSLTIKLDTARMQAAMNSMVYDLKADGVKLLQEEMRLLLKDILSKTPPTKSPRGDDAPMSARQRGSTAIENDMRRLATPLAWKEIKIPELAEAVRGRKFDKIKAIVQNVPAWKNRKVYTSLSELQSAHLMRRNQYGRIRGRCDALAIGIDWSKYTRTLKKRVGWTRAGWWKAAQALGLSLPNWVIRHQSYAPSGYYAPSPNNLSIESVNRSIKIPNYFDRHVMPAMKQRGRSLEREVGRLLRGGKSRRGSLANTPTGQAD